MYLRSRLAVASCLLNSVLIPEADNAALEAEVASPDITPPREPELSRMFGRGMKCAFRRVDMAPWRPLLPSFLGPGHLLVPDHGRIVEMAAIAVRQ